MRRHHTLTSGLPLYFLLTLYTIFVLNLILVDNYQSVCKYHNLYYLYFILLQITGKFPIVVLAAEQGCPEIVAMLLKKGALPNKKDVCNKANVY